MKKLYICGPDSGGEGIYDLVADDGECLASHFCSHKGYAKGDLESNRPERIANWKKRFGKYQVLWLGEDDLTKEEIKKRNNDWFATYKKNKLKEEK
jgi:hypothetical protein